MRLLEEQSDQDFHCLLFHLQVSDKIPSGLASLFDFEVNYREKKLVSENLET